MPTTECFGLLEIATSDFPSLEMLALSINSAWIHANLPKSIFDKLPNGRMAARVQNLTE
jgi:hypothetical protein